MTRPFLTITTLGTAAVWRDGQRCAFATRKTLALVIYLAVTKAPHARAQLRELLWSASDEAHANNGLRRALTFARHTLGAERIVADRDRVMLRLEAEDGLDIRTVEAASLLALVPWQESHLVALTGALALHQGAFCADLALPDAPAWEEWVLRQDAMCKRHLDAIGTLLCQQLLDNGQCIIAQQVAEQWIALHPHQEAAHRYSIEAALAAGDAPRAMTAFTACQRIIVDELGLALSPECADLLPCIHDLTRTAPKPAPMSLLPFGGRDREWRVLRAQWRDASAGRTQSALICGERGIGKTRLLQEFARWARARGADVLWGAPAITGEVLPYHALVGALRKRLAIERAPDDLLSDIWLAELARVIPDLRDRYPDLPYLVDESSMTRHRLFEAFAQATLTFAKHAPLALLIDDAHLLDDATRGLVAFLYSRWREEGSRIHLVLSLSLEETALHGQVQRWAQGMIAQDCERLQLAPLSLETTRIIIQQLASMPVSDAVATRLHAVTAGHPRELDALTRRLVEAPRLDETMTGARVG